MVKRNIPPPIPPSPLARLDARRKAELAAETAASSKTAGLVRGKYDKPKESGGPSGLEPTRYGDWEKSGRCVDF